MKKLLTTSFKFSILSILFFSCVDTHAQSKLDSIFELSKECLRVKNTYELEPISGRSNYDVKCSISEEGLILMSLENYSQDTLELEYDCGLFHFFIEVKRNDTITKHDIWCDLLEFRKYQLYPAKGIKSCFSVLSDQWIGKNIRVG